MAENLRKGISLPITTYIVYTDSRQLSRDKVSRFQLIIALSPRPARREKRRNSARSADLPSKVSGIQVLALAPARNGEEITGMSRLRRPFLHDRFIFGTVNHAGVRAERQERRCGLRVDRVSLTTYRNTPI